MSGAVFAQDEPATTPAAPAAPAASIPTTPFFRDVPRDHWAYAAVQRLAGAGIIEGYPAGPETKTLAEIVPSTEESSKTAPAPVAAKIEAPKIAKVPAAKAPAKVGTKKPVAGAKAKVAK